MKRTLSVLLAGLLVFAVAGQAAAFFEDLNLIRSVYTTTGVIEVGTDLGALPGTNTAGVPPTATLGQRNPDIALSLFDGNLSSLNVGYFSHGQATEDFYATGFLTTAYGGTDTDGLTMLGRKQSTADGSMNFVQAAYTPIGGSATTVLNAKSSAGGYFQSLDQAGDNIGSMGNNLKNDSFEMTLSLANLATVGYVDQLLYFFDYNAASGDKAGTALAIIRTFLTSNGSTVDLAGTFIATEIRALSAPVPVPAAVWLLGTGLIGLVGIRRRKN